MKGLRWGLAGRVRGHKRLRQRGGLGGRGGWGRRGLLTSLLRSPLCLRCWALCRRLCLRQRVTCARAARVSARGEGLCACARVHTFWGEGPERGVGAAWS